jgi:hypothetical protein
MIAPAPSIIKLMPAAVPAYGLARTLSDHDWTGFVTAGAAGLLGSTAVDDLPGGQTRLINFFSVEGSGSGSLRRLWRRMTQPSTGTCLRATAGLRDRDGWPEIRPREAERAGRT